MAPTFDSIAPMLADSRRFKPFNSPDWRFEIKNDGYMMLAQFVSSGVA